MKSKKVKRIVILGGGTAGWLSAHYLRRCLGAEVEITVLAASSIGIIGVGEATIPTLRFTLKLLGLKEKDWMPFCNATYKLAIKFNNWRTVDHAFYHPFQVNKEFSIEPFGTRHFPDQTDGFNLINYYVQSRGESASSNIAYDLCYNSSLCDNNQAPKNLTKQQTPVNYAYHLNSHLFGQFLCERAKEKSIEHIDDIFTHADLNEKGEVISLNCESGRKLKGDFFVDCSGFKSLLLGKTLGGKFKDCSDELFTNAAVTFRANFQDDEVPPYTLATARDYGWTWDVPLRNDRGIGYVYHSQFKNQDDIYKELLTLYPGEAVRAGQFSNVNFIPGRLEKTWKKNVVAIGLSGSFLEPLESTSIGLIEYQLYLLTKYFPFKGENPVFREKYNQNFSKTFDQVKDFIALHFLLSERNDSSFWQEVQRRKLDHPAMEVLNNLEERFLDFNHYEFFQLFGLFSYASVLLPMGAQVSKDIAIYPYKQQMYEARLQEIQEKTNKMKLAHPTHKEYLEHLYNN